MNLCQSKYDNLRKIVSYWTIRIVFTTDYNQYFTSGYSDFKSSGTETAAGSLNNLLNINPILNKPHLNIAVNSAKELHP